MPFPKQLSSSHKVIADRLAFLARSPAYRSQDIIVWRVGEADIIKAANDLSDIGLVGVEQERVGRMAIASISVSRDRVETLVDRVVNLMPATV